MLPESVTEPPSYGTVGSAVPLIWSTERGLFGRHDAARIAYEQAISLGMNEPQAEHLRRRLAELA